MKIFKKKLIGDENAYISPAAIVGVLGALIVLAVAIYAFFLTVDMIPTSSTVASAALNNTTQTGNTVFNIVGAVISIGAIMSLIGVIMTAFRGGR